MTDNFIKLKEQWGKLYKHAISAEKNISAEPEISFVQMRCFIEVLVGILYRKLNLKQPNPDTLFNRLDTEEFREFIPKNISSRIHEIRILGNKAAHGINIDPQNANELLLSLHKVSEWFYWIMTGDTEQWPTFVVSNSEEIILEDSNSINKSLDDLKSIQECETIALAETNIEKTVQDINNNEIKVRAKEHSSQDIESSTFSSSVTLEDIFTEYELNAGQKSLVKELDSFLNTDKNQIFLLKGYAGTGKTFITKGLTEYFKSIGRNYVLLAPTGKAAKVIEQKTQSPSSTIHKTIYSFKQLKQYKEDINGTETYKVYAELANNNSSVDTVYIIDEASMISNIYHESEFFRFGSGYLLKDLMQFINLDHNDHHKKVIFIGDNAQLPPVGMNHSTALSENYLHTEFGVNIASFELKEVVRQKSESGIIKNSMFLRESINKNLFNKLVVDTNFSDVKSLHYDKFMEDYLASSDGKINANTIVIAFSNADVSAYNKRIREHFFPQSTELQMRDKIIIVSNFYDSSGNIIANGEFGMINSVNGAKETRKVKIRRKNDVTNKIDEIIIELAFRDVDIIFKDLKGNPYSINCKIIESLLENDQADLSSDERKALYVDFCIRHPQFRPDSLEFKECLKNDSYFNALRIKYGYAITCHKAQGSEWNDVC